MLIDRVRLLPYNYCMVAQVRKRVSRETQARVEFRLPAAIKNRLREAAAHVAGGDLTAFILTTLLDRADRVLAERETWNLDERTRTRFYEAMRDPSPPSEALRMFLKQEPAHFRLVD